MVRKDLYKINYDKYINNPQFDDFINNTTIMTSNNVWGTNPLTTGDVQYIDRVITTSDGWYTTDGTQTISMPSAVYPAIRTPNTEEWPALPDTLGLVYIEGNEIKIRMVDDKTIVIGRLDDGEDFVPIEVIAAKKKLID